MIIKPNLQTVKNVVKYGLGVFAVLAPYAIQKEKETKVEKKDKK